ACPYCRRGHEDLTALLPKHPDIEVVWRPCEAHPRPEVYGTHSDLCIQALLFAAERGADTGAFHTRMYQAALGGSVNIEDPEALARFMDGLVDPSELLAAFRSGRYAQAVLDGNDYAYEQSGVWVVPAYRMDGRKLDSEAGIGVSRKQIETFLS
ncbi:MAG: DsbA family protein, partial [Oscillospiraceae bacterium]|nr:DsbA family protein [Oscillospiraceae bacterium]